jgi:hypothetical protein
MNAIVPTDETMPKRDFQAVQMRQMDNIGGMALALSNFAEVEKFAHFMALSNFVPKHMRGKQADCIAVTLQSMRWNMDPFAVAQKTYFVNDGMGYEAQLVNSIIISRAPLKARPKFTWSGDGESLKCKVSATFIGEEAPSEFEAEIKTISTRNSPLWKQQPRQQLGYFALRAWARLYCPDVLMGVYTKEEREEFLDVTPDQTQETNAINEALKTAATFDVEQNTAPVPPAQPEEPIAAQEGAPSTPPTEEDGGIAPSVPLDQMPDHYLRDVEQKANELLKLLKAGGDKSELLQMVGGAAFLDKLKGDKLQKLRAEILEA